MTPVKGVTTYRVRIAALETVTKTRGSKSGMVAHAIMPTRGLRESRIRSLRAPCDI